MATGVKCVWNVISADKYSFLLVLIHSKNRNVVDQKSAVLLATACELVTNVVYDNFQDIL